MGRGVNPVDLGGRARARAAASANQPSVKALYVESVVAATGVDKCLLSYAGLMLLDSTVE